ncbi:MAG: hypothetical protein IH600_12725 [Bacteroidetes bacterium]|nr:hypothetical protein [Bacteroidota bacterium]
MKINARHARFFFPLMLAAILIAVYLPLILQQNDFRTDDYYLLTLLKQHGMISPFDGVHYAYFSAFRVVPMLSLLADYLMYGPHPLGFYLFNLTLHIATVLLFFSLLKLLFQQFFHFTDELLPFFLALLMGLHADLFYNVLWICNRTEGFLLFFYLSTVYAWFRFFTERNGGWYLVGLLSLLLALLSKEQAIHLPLMFILIGVVARHFQSGEPRWRSLLLAAVPVVAFASGILLLRWIYDPSAAFQAGLVSPRKLLSLVGINLIAFHPTIAKPVFLFFVDHKLVAGLIGAVLSGSAIFAFSRSVQRTRRLVLVLMLAFVIIAFPRIFYQVFPRVNSIQVVYLLVVMGIILLRWPVRWMSIAALLLVMLQAAGMAFELPTWRMETSNDRYEQLARRAPLQGGMQNILLLQYHDHARYILYFLRKGDFGVDSSFTITPLEIDRRYAAGEAPEYEFTQQDSALIFRMNDPRVVFLYDTTLTLPDGIEITLADPAPDYGFRSAMVSLTAFAPHAQYLIERNFEFEILPFQR